MIFPFSYEIWFSIGGFLVLAPVILRMANLNIKFWKEDSLSRSALTVFQVCVQVFFN